MDKLETALDHAPVWNKAMAEKLEPLGVLVDLALIAVAVMCIWAVVKWKHAGIKALLLAFLLSP